MVSRLLHMIIFLFSALSGRALPRPSSAARVHGFRWHLSSMPTLVNCGQGLMTVDMEASTVLFIYFTLQEYRSAHPDIFSKPHSAMAKICLACLNSRQVKALSTAPALDTQNTPFLG